MRNGSIAHEAIIGNRALLDKLDCDIRESSLSHAYIIDGPEGSGRHTIARYVCRALACVNRPGQTARPREDQLGLFDALDIESPSPPADGPVPCGECVPCRKVMEDKCPDIRIIGREGKASIGVDAVRFLRSDVPIAPNDLDTKVYIIEDAETMTVQAQNALLLTLEDPPPYVLFLLLCNGADSLLETIRSRAPVLKTTPVPDEDIRAYLRARKCTLPEDELSVVLRRADGCIGQALTLTDPKAVKAILKRRTLTDTFLAGCAARDPAAVLTATGQFGTKRDAVCEILDTILLALRDLLLVKSADHPRLRYYTDHQVAAELAARMTMRMLLTEYDAVTAAREALERNGSVRLTMTRMCLDAGLP